MAKIDRARRIQLAKDATDIRIRHLTAGDSVETISKAILTELPDLLPLEAWRLANGWTRTEVLTRLDALYEQDGLRAPHITGAQLCKWEHGDVRPSEERIDYLSRLYQTSSSELGFGVDYSRADVNHLQAAGLTEIFPRTNDDSQADLLGRIKAARQCINMFGLTRNFYVSDHALPLFEQRAVEIPVHFYVMHPYCESRQDRYRLEPAEAAMEDPLRYTREFLRPLYDAQERINRIAKESAGFHVWTYNFPCAFAVEEIDDACRVMFYGAGKRGTEGPVLVFQDGTSYFDYFAGQIRFLERLASEAREPWRSKGLRVEALTLDLFEPGVAHDAHGEDVSEWVDIPS